MRLLLPILLLLSSAASAISLTSTTPIPGHAAGSFGLSDEPFGQLSGGTAWSADGSLIYTLDTTRELKVWRASDGALQRGQRLTAPAFAPDEQADFPSTELNLSGTADAQGLPLTARSWKTGTPSLWRYRLDTGSGRATKDAVCPADLTIGLGCAGGARVWQEGRTIRWQRGGETRTLTLPTGLQTKTLEFSSMALSPDGQRLALLALDGDEVRIFGGAGVLLTWEWGAAQPTQTRLGGSNLMAGSTLHWAGEDVLLGSNVYRFGNVYGDSSGQRLMLVAPGRGAVWELDESAELRGVYPSPDGTQFVAVRSGSVPEVRRVDDGRFVRALGAAVLDAEPLAGGKALLAVQDGGGFGRIVRHRPGELATLYRGQAKQVASNRDGSRFASSAGRKLRLHDIGGKVLREWQTEGPVLDLAFSPDGAVLSARIITTYQVQGVENWREETRAWRVADGTVYPLPAGTEFPVSSVLLIKEDGRTDGNYRERRVVREQGSGRELWTTPAHSTHLGALASPDGRWLAQTGMTQSTVAPIPERREAPLINHFSRVDARTGKSGPVLKVPVEHSKDPYAGWGLAAFDGEHVLLSESSGDGCGASLYGYQLANLAAGRLLDTPARLNSGYARLMGCGVYNPWPKAAFAPDGRLLIRDGNRLDWWTLD